MDPRVPHPLQWTRITIPGIKTPSPRFKRKIQGPRLSALKPGQLPVPQLCICTALCVYICVYVCLGVSCVQGILCSNHSMCASDMCSCPPREYYQGAHPEGGSAPGDAAPQPRALSSWLGGSVVATVLYWQSPWWLLRSCPRGVQLPVDRSALWAGREAGGCQAVRRVATPVASLLGTGSCSCPLCGVLAVVRLERTTAGVMETPPAEAYVCMCVQVVAWSGTGGWQQDIVQETTEDIWTTYIPTRQTPPSYKGQAPRPSCPWGWHQATWQTILAPLVFLNTPKLKKAILDSPEACYHYTCM
jgi:hypothetical protein